MLGNFNILCHFAMTDRHRVHVKMAKTSKTIALSRIIDKIEQSYLDRTVFALGALPKRCNFILNSLAMIPIKFTIAVAK